MHFQSLQPLKLTFKLEKNYLENEDQPVRKVVDLRTRNPTNFSLYFSDFSMIFQSFRQLLQNNPSQHYSFESWTSQKGPCTSFYCCLGSLAAIFGTEEALGAWFRRARSPAARARWGRSKRGLVRTYWWSQLGQRWSVAGWQRTPAAGGGPVPRRRHSGEGEAAGLGR